MKKIAYLAVAAMMAATSVYAGGQTMEPTSSDPSWTGFYVGADVGYMWGHSDLYDVNGFNSSGNNPFSYHPDGGVAALHAGYQHLFRHRYLLGAEALGGYTGMDGAKQYPPYIGVRTGADSVAHTKDGAFIGLFARLGLVGWKKFLFYGKGGYVWTSVSNTFTDTDPTGTTLSGTTNPSRDGAGYGGGVEYAFNHHWTGRVDYTRYDFGNVTSTGTTAAGTVQHFRHSLDANSVLVGASYMFS